MNILLRPFCLLFGTAALLSAAEPTDVTLTPTPAYPTVLTVSYGKDMLSVVKVHGTDPVVIVDGKEKRIVTEPTYMPGRTTAFAHGFVQMSDSSLAGLALKEVPTIDALNSSLPIEKPNYGASYFETKLKSKQRLEGAFALILVYPSSIDSLKLPLKYAGPNIFVHELPVLPAGEVVPVKFSATLPGGSGAKRYFVQIFDATGHEVRTNGMRHAGIYYHAMDLIMAGNVTEKYREKFAGANHDVVAYLKAPPVFPDNFTKPTQPGSATLTISSGGEVIQVELAGIADVHLQHSLADAFGGWVFLPRLKAGEPVACKVKMPLQF